MKTKRSISVRPTGVRAMICAAVMAFVMGGFASTGYAAANTDRFSVGSVQPAFGFHFWKPVWNHFFGHSFWNYWRSKSNTTEYSEVVGSCGYSVRSGTYSTWPFGYQAWVDVKNVSGETGTDFQVLLDIGDTTISHGSLADYEQTDDGYMVSAPHWLKWRKIEQGEKYRFHFNGSPEYQGVTPYVISVNGETCDTEDPQVTLAANDGFFNAEGTLTLTADASDNTVVRKVVFKKGDEIIGEDTEAPYELDVEVTEDLNGFHLYTATAYDPTGNEASTGPERVFVAINNKFFGTAPGGEPTYADVLTYFDQITPENAGKWGSVEAERDVMDWEALDTAYYFAQNNGLPFKYHTLIWGQQQPGWLEDLTPEEQLAEVEEWMAAVANRYPDLTMIEVVNEPLHAEPGYKEALGGDGDTGWDWLITSFELAREYFPEAQLILNDYQILHLPQFVQDYLEPIGVLQERDLIDAIGVQAHFLERTSASTVQQSLDTLAETGLPIYASEFDLNLADDARHANQMRDLFTVLWEHPAVAGVTHWGHLEGTTWREDAYLIRNDGTLRPGMEWIVCYLGGGTDCTVPEWVPSGWQGDEFGVTMEAELFDDGEGVLALGSSVAYTNPGDWIAFYNVDFQEGWDTFWLTYARGLEEDNGATITVHLDDLDSPPILTVDIEYTGGWGSEETVEFDWSSISGERDVFIRFNEDEEAIANLNNIRFGRPRPTSDVNLVGDGGFEGASLDGGWSAFGSSSNLNLTTGQFYDGLQSLEVSNRTGTGGFAAYWLTDKVSAGTTYSVSAQVLHDGAAADTVRIVAKVSCEGEDDAYNWLDNNTAVEPNTWTQLSGEMAIPEGCGVNEVQLFFEGPAETSTVYIDEVKVAPPQDANLVTGGDFEGGSLSGGWSAFGSDTTLSLSTAQFNSGAQSLLADRNTGTGGFAAYNLTSVVTPGLSYLASAWVYQDGAAADTVRMVAKVSCDGEDDAYNWVANNTAVEPATWTQLSGSFQIPLDCAVTDVQLYFEGTTAGVDVYIDDVSVNLPEENLVTGGDFEGASLDGGWGTWYQSGTSLGLTTDKAVSGSQSMLASSRAENSHPSYVLTSLVEAGTTYAVSAQALHTAGAPDTLTLTYKLACDGEDDVYSAVQSVSDVASDTWTELSGTMEIPAGCSVTESRIYFEGTTTGVDLYIDDVSVTAN